MNSCSSENWSECKLNFLKTKLKDSILAPLVLFCPSGPKANNAERKAAMNAAEQFIKDHNYPKNTQVKIDLSQLKPSTIS